MEKYIVELNSTNYKSYGAIIEGYVPIPDELIKNLDLLSKYSIRVMVM